LDYLVPGLLGFLAGAAIFGLTYPQVFPKIAKIANLGSVVLPDLLNINPYLTVLAFTLLSLLLFYFIDRMGMQRKNDEDKEK
jgi:membrane protein implicated in regulation of membrane protease activity